MCLSGQGRAGQPVQVRGCCGGASPGQSLQREWLCCVCPRTSLYHHTVGCLTADRKCCLVTVCLEAVTKLYQRDFFFSATSQGSAGR